MSLKVEIVNLGIRAKSQTDLYNKLAVILGIDKEDNPLYYVKVDHFISDPDRPKDKVQLVSISLYFVDYNKYLAHLELLVKNI